MYSVPPYRWVKVSRMHFRGAAARWIESLHHPDRIPWPDFCKMLHDRFGRDQHDRLSRQMFHINQSSTVLDYVERFSSLFDQLKAYQSDPDMHYYTTRFIDGLKHEIRIAVAIQRPSNLDTAYMLALLQEEMAEAPKKSEFHGYNRGARPGSRPVQTSLRQPAGASSVNAEKSLTKPQVQDDKISALRAYRRARGLCDFCAEKWFRGHKCASAISLHAMQEIWDLFHLEALPADVDEDRPITESPPEHLFVALSQDAQRGSQGRQTIQFLGSLQGLTVTVLVDSGSSASFLATSVASQLQHLPRTASAASVKVANGHTMRCTASIPDCNFFSGHNTVSA